MAKAKPVGNAAHEIEHLARSEDAGRRSPLEAVHAHCLWCCNGHVGEVAHCPARHCPLWILRSGHRPNALEIEHNADVALHPSERAYVLAPPVGTCDSHRLKPIEYAAAVQRGMTRRLGADPAHANRLAKNPLHPQWRASWIVGEPYNLATLREPLDYEDTRWYQRRTEIEGISRNCDLFEELRRFAYRHVQRGLWDTAQHSRASRGREFHRQVDVAQVQPPEVLRHSA